MIFNCPSRVIQPLLFCKSPVVIASLHNACKSYAQHQCKGNNHGINKQAKQIDQPILGLTKIGKVKIHDAYKYQKRCLLPQLQGVRLASGGVEPSLVEVLSNKITDVRQSLKQFLHEYGKCKVADISVQQLYGGMRDLMTLIWEPSVIDADDGIRFRGLTINEVLERLPKHPDNAQPMSEGMFWLLATGEIPTKTQASMLSGDWAERAILPQYIEHILSALPENMHPMTSFTIAVNALSYDSKFKKAYSLGTSKITLWQHVLEDSMNLIAKLPLIAARIYNKCYRDSMQPLAEWCSKSDWSLNFANQLGYSDPEFVEWLRLYLILHSDHEGGNISSHATHLVGSALSDPYLAYASGLNGLAGPLHGLANQEVLTWLRNLETYVGKKPTNKQIEKFCAKTLKDGKTIPGYGHAILRKIDPRFLAEHDFALHHMPEDELFQLGCQVYKVLPPYLKKLDKINPYPNVDALSGILLQHYGMKETEFYIVLFGVSRALGALAQLIWSSALCLPLQRTKSVSTDYLRTILKELDKHKKCVQYNY